MPTSFRCSVLIALASNYFAASPLASAWVPSPTNSRSYSSKPAGVQVPFAGQSPSVRSSSRSVFSVLHSLESPLEFELADAQKESSSSSFSTTTDSSSSSRRKFLVQNMCASAFMTIAAGTFTAASVHVPTAYAATAATDQEPDPFATDFGIAPAENMAPPAKWPLAPSPLPSRSTSKSMPPSNNSANANAATVAEAAETTDFFRALEKAATQKQVDPRTHG
jgi:hypothetical protein